MVNLLGCFAIGLLYGAFSKTGSITEDWKLFLTVGICGGFTTFSSFSYENIKMLQQGQAPQALMYLSLSVVLGLLLTYVGISMASK